MAELGACGKSRSRGAAGQSSGRTGAEQGREHTDATMSDSSPRASGNYDLYKNKNVEWMTGTGTKACYILFLFLVWGLLHVSRTLDAGEVWLVTNVIHGVSTFVFFHWIKGCPDDSTQGEYNGFTLYEQIDAGIPWTNTKKFLMLVPALVCWVACWAANYKPVPVVVNMGIFIICLIAKIPEMHRVRIFGINSTPGIDTPIEYTPKTKKSSSSSKRD